MGRNGMCQALRVRQLAGLPRKISNPYTKSEPFHGVTKRQLPGHFLPAGHGFHTSAVSNNPGKDEFRYSWMEHEDFREYQMLKTKQKFPTALHVSTHYVAAGFLAGYGAD